MTMISKANEINDTNKNTNCDKVELHENERLDDLLAGGLKIIQNKTEFCFSLDAVLLAHFATVRKNDCGLDLGTGTGVLPLLLSSRAKKIDALEINPVTFELAQRNIRLNNLEHKLSVMHGNLCEIGQYCQPSCMDFVVSNPPYRQINHGHLNELDGVARARHEISATLDDVVKAASYALKYRGRFAMVHLPERLNEIILAFHKYNIAAKRLQFVQPKKNKAPNIVLIEGVKNGSLAGLKVEPALIVHEDNGDYTAPLLAYYYPDRLNLNQKAK